MKIYPDYTRRPGNPVDGIAIFVHNFLTFLACILFDLSTSDQSKKSAPIY